jgi:hypothetical protein
VLVLKADRSVVFVLKADKFKVNRRGRQAEEADRERSLA